MKLPESKTGKVLLGLLAILTGVGLTQLIKPIRLFAASITFLIGFGISQMNWGIVAMCVGLLISLSGMYALTSCIKFEIKSGFLKFVAFVVGSFLYMAGMFFAACEKPIITDRDIIIRLFLVFVGGVIMFSPFKDE